MYKTINSTIALFSVSAISALGTGIEQGYHDPTAAARGNAFVATADNPSAVHYNPAGLAWQDGISAQSVTYVSRANIKFSGTAGKFKHIQAVPTGAFFLNYAGLADGKLALGLGATIPYGLGLKFKDSNPLRTLGTEAYLAHIVISPAISYKFNDKFSLGMTLNYAHDDYEAVRGVFVPGDSFRFEGSGIGWGYSLGALFKPNDQWSFGVTYRASIKTTLNGTATTNTTLPVAINLTEPASTRFNYPQQVIVGAAFKPNDKWSFEANVQWTDWSSFDEGILIKPSGNAIQALNYQDTIAFGLGASNTLNEKTTLNFGYFFSTPAAPAKTYNPFTANTEINVFSVGIDHTIQKWQISASLLYIYGRKRTISGSTPSLSGVNADGNWSSNGLALAVGAKYKF